jgi:hypothetical protein
VRPFTVLGFLLLALALAAPAAAQRGTLAPPGNSGVDEYKETIPTSRGNRPTDSLPGGGGGGGLNQGAQRSLDRLGADGQTVADLAKRTAPPKARPGDRGAVADAQTSDEGSPFGAVFKRVFGVGDDGSGSGALLPLTLLAGLVALSAIALLRRRRAPER